MHFFFFSCARSTAGIVAIQTAPLPPPPPLLSPPPACACTCTGACSGGAHDPFFPRPHDPRLVARQRFQFVVRIDFPGDVGFHSSRRRRRRTVVAAAVVVDEVAVGVLARL